MKCAIKTMLSRLEFGAISHMARAGVFAILFAVLFALPAAAQSPFDMLGFRYSPDPNGLHYYACEAPACGNNTASFTYQDYTQDFSMAQFEDAMTQSFHAWASRRSGTLTVGRVKSVSMGKLRAWTVTANVSRQGHHPDFVVGGFITGGVRRVSLISAANSSAAAQRNFDAFARKLKPLIEKGAFF